jgi:hypothetical protein
VIVEEEEAPYLAQNCFQINISMLRGEELHNLYVSPIIVTVIKRRRMRCAGHVEYMGETRNAYNILVGKGEGNT